MTNKAGPGVAVAVGVAVALGVEVAVAEVVAVAVMLAVEPRVAVELAVGVALAVAVEVSVAVAVAVRVGVAVAVLVGVAVTVRVGPTGADPLQVSLISSALHPLIVIVAWPLNFLSAVGEQRMFTPQLFLGANSPLQVMVACSTSNGGFGSAEIVKMSALSVSEVLVIRTLLAPGSSSGIFLKSIFSGSIFSFGQRGLFASAGVAGVKPTAKVSNALRKIVTTRFIVPHRGRRAAQNRRNLISKRRPRHNARISLLSHRCRAVPPRRCRCRPPRR